MKRSLILALSWVVYIGLLGMIILCEVSGMGYFFEMDFDPRVVTAGMYLSIYYTIPLAIPIFIRWKLKNATWGTFAVYMFVLAVALGLQGVLQSLVKNHQVSDALMVLAWSSFVVSVYFMYKNVLHVKAVVDEIRTQKKRIHQFRR